MKPDTTKKEKAAVKEAAKKPDPKKKASLKIVAAKIKTPKPKPDPLASTAVSFDPITLGALLALDSSDGIRVSYRQKITGRVSLGFSLPTSLQIQPLVYSADGRWYRQKAAEIKEDGTWSVECVFGYHDSVHEFSVVVVVNGGLTEGRYDQIPAAPLTSIPITVVRTTVAPPPEPPVAPVALVI